MAANIKVRGVTIDQLLANLSDGVDAVFPSGSSLVIDGVTYDKASLQKKLEEVISPFNDAEDARSKASTAVARRNTAEPAAADFASRLSKGLEALYGSDADSLAKFGLGPARSKKQLTAQEKADRVALAKATRALRHTMGPRQKAEIKATSVSTAAPAPSATSTGMVPAPAPSAGGSTASTGSIPAPTPAPANPVAVAPATTGTSEVNGAAH